MAKIKLLLDPIGNTLNVWWGKTSKTDYCEESRTTDDVIIYNKDGRPIGVEIIGLFPSELNMTNLLGNKKIEKSTKKLN